MGHMGSNLFVPVIQLSWLTKEFYMQYTYHINLRLYSIFKIYLHLSLLILYFFKKAEINILKIHFVPNIVSSLGRSLLVISSKSSLITNLGKTPSANNSTDKFSLLFYICKNIIQKNMARIYSF